jgi:hypothetical protein
VLPDKECGANPATVLAATATGGHVAFVRGWAPLAGAALMDDAVLQVGGCVLQVGGCAPVRPCVWTRQWASARHV